MTRWRSVFWAWLTLLSLLWWLADGGRGVALDNVFQWRGLLTQYTGVLGIGVMSLAMVLAVRPVVLEPWLGGLDKMYRLHKWLGIAGLVLSVAHWAWTTVPKWLVGWGWLVRPPRGPRPVYPDGSIQQWLQGQRGLAETLGEWAFYVALLLMVLALVKRFPYKLFFQTHRWLALAYLVLVWHSLVLMKFDYWATPLGPGVAVSMALGAVAAVVVLTRRVAIRRQVLAEVAQVQRFPSLDVVEVVLRLRGRWPGHQAGQFAFATFHGEEGAHPFTISSAWADDGRLAFVIKGLGDYTRGLGQRLRLGDEVTVEGPYGRFNFQGTAPRQIWVGAGIGITPFIARMKALAQAPDGKAVDLFHPTSVYDPAAIGLLQRDAQTAGVRLHVLWSERDGRLNAERLMAAVPQWHEAEVWFCGPVAFGQALRDDLVARGLPAARFHQELFDMR